MTDARNVASMSIDDILDARRTVASAEEAAELDRRWAEFPERDRIHVLKRRGELRSLSERGRVVGYSSGIYIVSLVMLTCVLLSINLLSLVEGRWLALISVSIQIAVLVSLAIRHHFQIFLVRVWAIVAVIGGAAFIVSQLAQAVVIATATAEEAPAPISFTKILLGVIELSAGVYFYGASIRSTRFEHSEHEPKLEGPWTT